MKAGDKVYAVYDNMVENIREYVVKSIVDGCFVISYKYPYDNRMHDLKLSLKLLDKWHSGYFTTYEKAVKNTEVLARRYRRMSDLYKSRDDRHLDWALENKATTIPDVVNNGVVIMEKWKDDTQALLYEYNYKEYVVIYRHNGSSKECVAFYQRQK